MKELKKTSCTRNPDFIMGYSGSDKLVFACLECRENITLIIDKEIFECLEGFINLSKKEYEFLKRFYNIGYAEKSHEGDCI